MNPETASSIVQFVAGAVIAWAGWAAFSYSKQLVRPRPKGVLQTSRPKPGLAVINLRVGGLMVCFFGVLMAISAPF